MCELREQLAQLQKYDKQVTEEEVNKMFRVQKGALMVVETQKGRKVIAKIKSFSWNEGLQCPEIVVSLFERSIRNASRDAIVLPEDVLVCFEKTTSIQAVKEIVNAYNLVN